MGNVWKDFQVALRFLGKNRAYTGVAIVTLALAIGANTTVFSVVQALLNFPIPVDDPARVAFVFAENAPLRVNQGPASVDDFLDWREQSQSFEYLVAGEPRAFNFSGSGEPARVAAFAMSEGFFPAVGAKMAVGRPFVKEETAGATSRVVVLSYPFWQRQFGGEKGAVGRNILLDGESYTVVGVAQRDFFFPGPNVALWAPLALERGSAPREQRTLFVFGRLREGVTSAQATSEMQTISQRIAQAYAGTNRDWTARAVTAIDNFRQGTALATLTLYGSITFVLLIACANVANLMLARTTARAKEIAVRTALGASRRHLIRQLLTESVTLSLIGGVLGFLLGIWGMDALRTMIARDINVGFIAARMAVNQSVLLHTLGITVFAGLLFGLMPALRSTRPNLQEMLKEGARGSGGRRQRLLSGLVVAQTALALALLATTGVLVRAFNHIYRADPGLNPNGLLTFALSLPEKNYTAEQAAEFYRKALERLEQLPGVTAATTTTILPLTQLVGGATATVELEGQASEEEQRAPTAVAVVVSPGFFRAFEIPVVQGRAIEERDQSGTQAVAVVSRAMVRRYWPDREPLGQRFRVSARNGLGPWLTVAGVTEDVQTSGHSMRNTQPIRPHVFVPLAQSPMRDAFFAVRTSVEPTSLSAAAQKAIWELDSTQPVSQLRTLEEAILQIDTQNIFFLRILGSLSTIALVVAAVGIYGVTSYSVNQRSREIGIRMAVGAQARGILLMVIRQGTVLAVMGLALGLVAAVGFVRLLGSQLQGIGMSNAGSPATYVAVSLLLLGVSVLASYVPARRASRVDPVKVLHHE